MELHNRPPRKSSSVVVFFKKKKTVSKHLLIFKRQSRPVAIVIMMEATKEVRCQEVRATKFIEGGGRVNTEDSSSFPV